MQFGVLHNSWECNDNLHLISINIWLKNPMIPYKQKTHTFALMVKKTIQNNEKKQKYLHGVPLKVCNDSWKSNI